jgi:hypothetical protein
MDAQSLRANKRTYPLEACEFNAYRSAQLVKCRVEARTATGEQHSYSGLFPSTCDAVMDAFDRFGIAKISVEAIKQ